MEIVDNKCPSCGANLDYNPSGNNWICCQCGSSFDRKKSLQHHLKTTVNEIVCPNCNAKLFTNSNIISFKCVYCNNSVIVRKAPGYYSKPDKMIPFKISEDEVRKKILNLCHSFRLIPSCFGENGSSFDIFGVYVPFWLYSYEFETVINYSKPMLLDENDKNKYSRKRVVDIYFNMIPFDANKHLDNKITSSIEPYDYNDLIDFDTSYLSGFVAQRYDISSSEGLDFTVSRAKNSIDKMYLKTFNSNQIGMISKKLVSEERYYALLPLWLCNVDYNGCKYVIAINGQNGKLAGNLPLDDRKVLILEIILFLLFLFIFCGLYFFIRYIGVMI